MVTIDELWNLYRQEKDGKVKERLLIVIWMKEGVTSYEVGRRLNCPHSKAIYWHKRFKTEGIEGLKTRLASGRPIKMSDEIIQKIKKELEDKNFWQTKWVSELIYNETSIKYSQRHITRLLHKWGFEQITPRKEHAQADKEEQKEFLKKTKKYWVSSLKGGM